MKLQAGFSLVSAIFIVVILALIGSYIVNISSLTSSSALFAGQGLKAYYAARSGLEWGIYKVAPLGSSGPFNCPASPTTITFSQGGLSGFSAVVTCVASSFSEHGMTYNIFEINAIGQYQSASSADYVSRQLYVTIIQPGI